MYAQDMSAIDRNLPFWDSNPVIDPDSDIDPDWMLLIPPSGKTINTYLPMELMRKIFLYCFESYQVKSGQLAPVCRYWRSVMTTINVINNLPMELMREVLLYCIDSNQMNSGQLACVCRYWRSVITTLPRLWSTLSVGTWTERERVAIWLQRAYPKKIVIDTQRDRQLSPALFKLTQSAMPLAALRDALAHTRQWHELTISSFPPEHAASPLGVQVASPMNMLKVLHAEAGCIHSPSFAHLLNLVPTEAPLCEMRLHSPFVTTHFLQPRWFPVLQNLMVLIVNGRDMDEPFELLPTFTQLQIFEADRLHIPFYEPDTNLPLLCTLRKLQLKGCSVQWMAGRQFQCLEECAILLPRHWEHIQQYEVQLPSCEELAYHGYPMTTAQYFHAPKIRAIDLRSHDCNEQRVYQQLRHLCRVNRRTYNLTTLHLTFQCSEQVLMRVLKYLIPLQELTLSITHPSLSFQNFLESLAAKPSIDEWHGWHSWGIYYEDWEEWCSSQAWRANVLPRLKFLGLRCPKGFSQSARLDNFPFLRAIGWTRAYLTPPLEHLKVWEGRGSMNDMAVDYTSTGYLNKHLGMSSKRIDATIVKAILARHLVVVFPDTPLFPLHSTALFRQLRHLEINCESNYRVLILPYLEQIEGLKISGGSISEYSLNLDLPLTRTLQWLELRFSTLLWMLGRTFKALRELRVSGPPDEPENHSRHEGLRVYLPACTKLELMDCSTEHHRFLSRSNVQILRWSQYPLQAVDKLAAVNSLHDLLSNLSCLQYLYISVPRGLMVDSLIDFVFRGASEHGVWRDIRSVRVVIGCSTVSEADFIDQTVGDQPRYKTWWKSFTTERYATLVTISASM